MRRLVTLLILGALAASSMAQTRLDQVQAPAQPDCGCEGAPKPDVLAIVNGVKLTSKDVDAAIKAPLEAIHRQVAEARRLELDLQINSRLLDAEAKKRGKQPARLLEEEVRSKVRAPTDSEIKAYFDQNKEQMDSAFDDARPYIADYLRNQREAEAAKAFIERLRAASDLKKLVREATPPGSMSDLDRVFAVINGQTITSANVEAALKPLLIKARKQIYSLTKTQLDLMINDLLLEQEAQKRKLTTRAVVEADVLPKVRKVSDEDARRFYEASKEKLAGEFAELRDQIIEYLAENERQRAQLAFTNQLRSAASLRIYLKEPETGDR